MKNLVSVYHDAADRLLSIALSLLHASANKFCLRSVCLPERTALIDGEYFVRLNKEYVGPIGPGTQADLATALSPVLPQSGDGFVWRMPTFPKDIQAFKKLSLRRIFRLICGFAPSARLSPAAEHPSTLKTNLPCQLAAERSGGYGV